MIEDLKTMYAIVFGREAGPDFADETLLQYASAYENDPPPTKVRFVMQICAGRLALRALGTPSNDDPIGRNLSSEPQPEEPSA